MKRDAVALLRRRGRLHVPEQVGAARLLVVENRVSSNETRPDFFPPDAFLAYISANATAW